jgi:hypothetical protein
MPTQLPDSVRALLLDAGGGASANALVAHGLSRGQLSRLVRDGELVRLTRGSYVLPTPTDHPASDSDYWRRMRSEHLKELTALLTPDAAAALRTGALLRGLPVSAIPARPEVIRPPHSARRTKTRTVCTALSADEIDTVRGIPTTTLIRTCVDIALDLPVPESLISLDAALARGVERAQLFTALDRRGAVAGCRRARRAVQWADPHAESPNESRGRGTLLERGIPAPLCNLTFQYQHECFRPDAWWKGLGLIGEADGRVKYRSTGTGTDPLWEEKLRQQWFEAELGMSVYRWTDREMRLAPAAAAARWRQLAGLPAVRLWTPPAGLQIDRAPRPVRRYES